MQVTSTAVPVTSRVPVVSRAQWGAAPATAALGQIAGPVDTVFVHHTVTESGPQEREPELMRQVQQIAFDRGFSDISYSFLIFPTGNVYEGRGFGTVGAHTLGHNATSYAMCLVGNYENEAMTDAQVGAVRAMIAEGQDLGFISAHPAVRGHRSVASTACPGRHAMDRLDELAPTGPAAAPAFPGELARGSAGADVCRVQARLRALGHAIDSVPGCPFGPQTEAAVVSFQGRHGVPADGVVGTLTWAALFG
jgi:hypothetical protein